MLRRADGGRWWVDDLNSANGTYCDGGRITRLEVAGRKTLMLSSARDGLELVVDPGMPLDGRTIRVDGVERSLVRVGRAPDNDVVISEVQASRYHAEIRLLADGGIEIVDLSSTNGTRVNGKDVKRVLVAGEASIEIAGTRLAAVADRGTGLGVTLLSVPAAPGETTVTTVRLSERERQVVACVAGGATDSEIAGLMMISIATVRSHLDRIGDRTGFRRRPDLTRLALEMGLRPRRPDESV